MRVEQRSGMPQEVHMAHNDGGTAPKKKLNEKTVWRKALDRALRDLPEEDKRELIVDTTTRILRKKAEKARKRMAKDAKNPPKV